jgi:hypothetical protein
MTTFILDIQDSYLINCQNRIQEILKNDEICQSVKDFLIKSVHDEEFRHIHQYLKSKYVLNNQIVIVRNYTFNF